MKMFKLACLLLLALAVAGCGKKVSVPEKTIIAAYIDIEKAYLNGKSCAQTIIDALPSAEREKAKKKFDKDMQKIEKAVEELSAEWAVVTFGGNLKKLTRSSIGDAEEDFAVAVKVDADKDAVKKVLKDVFDMKDVEADRKNGHVVFECKNAKDVRVGLIDDQYLIFSPGEDAFDDMFDLYAGKGKASDEFDDLARISGDTVCRIQTAPVSRLLERFELTREIEKFGEAAEDEELVNMVLNMGSISLDVNIDDEVGLALHVACDSSSDAKVIENLMRSFATFARVGCDIVAYLAENPDQIDRPLSRKKKNELVGAKDLVINLAKNIKADRSWSVATLSFTLKTEIIADFIRKTSSESKRDDDDDKFSAKWDTSKTKKVNKAKSAYDSYNKPAYDVYKK